MKPIKYPCIVPLPGPHLRLVLPCQAQSTNQEVKRFRGFYCAIKLAVLSTIRLVPILPPNALMSHTTLMINQLVLPQELTVARCERA
jgi:hypothetical protein